MAIRMQLSMFAVALGLLATAPVAAQTGKKILWDCAIHGVYSAGIGAAPSTNSAFVNYVQSKGYTVTNYIGYPGFFSRVDEADLDQFSMIVVSVASTWNSAYTASEVNAIRNFVSRGGGLLLMAGNSYCPNDHIQPIAEAFGITCGGPISGSYNRYISSLAPSPLFDGCAWLDFQAASALTANQPATVLATASNGDGMICTATYGRGRVVATGSCYFMSDCNVNSQDNLRFARNIADYCLTPVPEPSSLVALLAGVGALVPFVRRSWK